MCKFCERHVNNKFVRNCFQKLSSRAIGVECSLLIFTHSLHSVLLVDVNWWNMFGFYGWLEEHLRQISKQFFTLVSFPFTVGAHKKRYKQNKLQHNQYRQDKLRHLQNIATPERLWLSICGEKYRRFAGELHLCIAAPHDFCTTKTCTYIGVEILLRTESWWQSGIHGRSPAIAVTLSGEEN